MHPEINGHIQVLREKHLGLDPKQPFSKALSAAIDALGSCDTLRSKLASERVDHIHTRRHQAVAEERIAQLEQELDGVLTSHAIEMMSLRRELEHERDRLNAVKAILAPLVRAHKELASDPTLGLPLPNAEGQERVPCWPGDEVTQPNLNRTY